MAKQRYINTRFWNDGFISNLDPIGKLLFLYFLTNEHTNICGVYELPMKIIVSETSIKEKKITEIIPCFCGKIVYTDGWVGIKNFAKYQNTENDNVKKGIKEALRGISKDILDKINKLHIANEGLCIPIQDQSHLNLDLDLDSDLDLDINSSQTTNFIPSQEKYLKTLKSRSSKVSSSRQLLAAEISEWSGGKLKIPMLMKFCNDKGEVFLRDCWASAKDSRADDPIKLFMWKYKQVKVETKNK